MNSSILTPNKTKSFVSVYLDPEYKRYLFDIGKGRNFHKKPSWSRRKTTVFTDEELDCLGMIGEGAIALFLNLTVNEDVVALGDGGIDMRCPNGLTLSIKFNHKWMGYLMIEERPEDTPDSLKDLKTDGLIMVCSFCDPQKNICRCREQLLNPTVASQVVIPGWISNEEFMAKKRYVNLGAGMRHYVTVDDLRHPVELAYHPF